ncbi:Tryptophan synthase alpha chain [Fulvivirga imtechensis AK7]|uniref:Tryptophan synthase alpha chain n=1 Tax=Fulvivirga imtechensis AK7 TaxID=1237149 RepID=L8JPW3_9BACT|nr:tryptophan synthase subunit alpha [Fulvivirga imtechensis]ELR70870.1 Tryptophan synthase alpha chain [Fulvivirga imtechensis AK7]
MNIKVTNRINELFEHKKSGILSVYYTAGFPKLNDTLDIARHLQAAGADLIEIGIPFSDPVADGPTIQQSNKQALDNGMTLKLLFSQLEELRQHVQIPVIMMGYINPVIQFGVDNFCKACEKCGIDGLILPDLPIKEYVADYKDKFEAHGLRNIFLITPQTAESRIREIDEQSDGFIYMVSSASTTGAKAHVVQDQIAYFQRVRAMQLKNQTLVGFGISNKETFETAVQNSNGAIIGSAFINLLEKSVDLEKDIKSFVEAIKGLSS